MAKATDVLTDAGLLAFVSTVDLKAFKAFYGDIPGLSLRQSTF